MENLEIYKMIEEVPNEAQKKINGGRLKGMTDIKPMWRIEKLTEVFGPVGLGWYAPITNKEIIEGANGEKVAIVDINLFVNFKKPYELKEDLWSEPITGTGGSSFITNEKSGPYTSDECFKMAYTDALSVACKSLGMGAKVYWGDSKYASSEKTIETIEQAREIAITFGKKHPNEKIVDIYEKDKGYLDWLLENEKTDTNIKQAIKLIYADKGIKVLNDDEKAEKLTLMGDLNELFLKTGVDRDSMYKHYKVSTDSDMTIEQLKDAISKLKGKEG